MMTTGWPMMTTGEPHDDNGRADDDTDGRTEEEGAATVGARPFEGCGAILM